MPVADMGEPNPLKEMIAESKGIEIHSIDVDFDHEIIPGRWGTILCFEVLEHLFNPLFALENIKAALLEGGVVYLSTPHRPHPFWTEHHFHEMDDMRLGWLFGVAGLTVVREDRIPITPGSWRELTGFRPVLRFLLRHKTRIIQLKAA